MPKAPPAKVKTTKAATEPAPAANAAPREWTNLAIATQVDVAQDGTVINPFTKTPIAKDSGGMLDVRRPGRVDMPKPEGVKASPSVAEAFAKWYMDTCYIAPVTEAECRERFDEKDFIFPEVAVDVKASPFALVTGTSDGKDYAFVVINGQIGRVGRRTERSYLWAYSNALIKARGEKMCPKFTRCEGVEDAFKVLLSSFTGKFRQEAAAAPAPKAEKKSAKSAPSKAAPKKVPTKK